MRGLGGVSRRLIGEEYTPVCNELRLGVFPFFCVLSSFDVLSASSLLVAASDAATESLGPLPSWCNGSSFDDTSAASGDSNTLGRAGSDRCSWIELLVEEPR